MSQFTPMRRQYTRVYLPNVSSGFDVSGCQNPEALAETIVTACNAHDQLVAALQAVTDVLDAFGNMPDGVISPTPWAKHSAEVKIKAAREALALASAK